MGKYELNKNLAQMLKGGVIMDVTNAEQAKIAEAAGACAVMALERVPADIRRDGGVARMSDPQMIKAIQKAVSIPVMAKVRIGHFVEAQILEARLFFTNVDNRYRSFRRNSFYLSEIIFVEHDIADNEHFIIREIQFLHFRFIQFLRIP